MVALHVRGAADEATCVDARMDSAARAISNGHGQRVRPVQHSQA
jgi:hypothetical protein